MIDGIRQYVPFMVAPPNKCAECKITLLPGVISRYRGLCDVCAEMLLAVSTPYFRTLHLDWECENRLRAEDRRRMIQPDGGGDEDDTQEST